ncbi:Xylulose kinase [Halioglobus japonicus]|nr:Xylulose kinase [Halioglobus japonicus]
MQTVLGLDLGTQSLKALFYDGSTRKVIACESAALDLFQDESGAAEQQAQWWLDALHHVLANVDPATLASVAAIGVSGQQHGFVALGKNGEVLAPVKLWCDTSTVAQCNDIMAAYGGMQRCIDDVGNPILAGYTAGKIRRFAKQGGPLYEQLDCILLPHDYLNFYLTGERCMEAGDASGTGFLDIRERRWSDRMLHAIDPQRDLTECLPQLRVDPGVIGSLRSDVAELTGLPAGIPVSTGGGDNMMGAIGTGNLSPGRVTMSMGTSGTVYAYSDKPVIDPKGEIAAFCSSTGGWLPLMCTMNCTVTTEQTRNLLGTELSDFERQVSRSPMGAEGLISLPFYNGERTPNLPRAKACVMGLDPHNARPENLLRSALEGATFALRYGLQRMRELDIDDSGVVLTGGGSASATWRQAVADICNTPVTILHQDEGAAFGAALQALAVLESCSLDEMQQFADDHLSKNREMCCEPNTTAVNFYDDVYQRYLQSLAAITPLYAQPVQ